MPELQFKGKEFVYNHHLSVPFRPLIPDAAKSVGDPSLSGNLIIHGDNLHALKALLPMYAGKVDCIFIDPPYNTGNEGWSYNDNVNSPMMKEWLSSNPINGEDMLRHDKWCAMMWPRLVLLRELLSEDGTIAVCIGNDESHHLRSMLDEIFGGAAFLTTLAWKSRAKPSNIGEAKTKPQNDAEWVLLYAKDNAEKSFALVNSGEVRSYPHEDNHGRYRLQTILKSNRGENERETMRFTIKGFTPSPDQRWQGGETLIQGLFDSNRAEFRDGVPFRKYYEHEENDEHSPFYSFVKPKVSGTAESGKNLLNRIMGNRHGLDTVKPLGIVEYVLERVVKNDGLVLDSFAGSGTTAHAVLRLNSRDNGSRRFILIEQEEYANTLTSVRIRKVMAGYDYSGSARDELLRTALTWGRVKAGHILAEQVLQLEQASSGYTGFTRTVEDGDLVVIGEKESNGHEPGVGGQFTFASLGPPLNLDKMLTGASLPEYLTLGAWLFHTATGEVFSPAAADESSMFLGESSAYYCWLVYKPELAFLKSSEAALTLSLAERIADAKPKGKKHLVFAPAKYVPNSKLLPMGVEFAPLPFALYRIERG